MLLFEAGPGLMIPVPGKGLHPYPKPPTPPGEDWTPPGRPDDPHGPRAAPPADLTLARAVLACPHKSPPRCSCNAFATCGLGKGNAGQVSYADCLACARAAREATGSGGGDPGPAWSPTRKAGPP